MRIPTAGPGTIPTMMEASEAILALRRGRCAGETCRDPIRPGELIVLTDEGWCHEECAPLSEEDRLEPITITRIGART